jgi:hypothetical protein
LLWLEGDDGIVFFVFLLSKEVCYDLTWKVPTEGYQRRTKNVLYNCTITQRDTIYEK